MRSLDFLNFLISSFVSDLSLSRLRDMFSYFFAWQIFLFFLGGEFGYRVYLEGYGGVREKWGRRERERQILPLKKNGREKKREREGGQLFFKIR